MKLYNVLILLILSFALNSLTLDEALDSALKNNKDLKKVKDDIDIAIKEYKSIKGNLLPQIKNQTGIFNSHTNLPDKADVFVPKISSLIENPSANESAIASVTDGFISGSLPELEQDKTTFGTKTSLNQVLYLGGKLNAGIGAAKVYENLTKTQYAMIKRNIIFETKKLYYGHILAQQALEINQEAMETANKHLQLVTNMNTNGIVSEYDLLRAELEVSTIEPKVVEAQNNLKLAKEALSKQIGIPYEEINIEGSIEFQNEDIESLELLLENAYSERKEIKLAKMASEMYKFGYKAEKGNYLPNIVFQAEHNLFAEGDDQFSLKDEDFGTSYQYGIAMEVPLFTGFSNTNKKQKAKTQFNKSKTEIKNVESLIRLDLRNSYLNYQLAIKNLEIQSRNIALANKGLEIAKVRYKNNVGIQLEVFDAQLKDNVAKLELLNAKYNALISYEQLLKAAGKYE